MKIFNYVFFHSRRLPTKGIFFIIFFALISCSISAQSDFIPFSNKKAYISNEFTSLPKSLIKHSSSEYLEIEYTFPGAFLTQSINDGIQFQSLNIQGFGYHDEIGEPAIPAHNDLIKIPFGTSPKISIIESEYVELSGYTIHPAQAPYIDSPDVIDPAFRMDQTIYSSNAYFPKDLVHILDIQTLKNTQIAIVRICPVQFKPSKKILRVYSKIRYKISFEGLAEQKSYTGNNSRNANRLLNKLTINSIPALRHSSLSYLEESSTYLIVTNDKYLLIADTLAKWKRQLGYSVRIVSKSSWSQFEIRDTVRAIYHAWNPHPDYLLIIGDHEDVPAQDKYSPIDDENGRPRVPFVTDLYYTCMDGPEDYFPEMARGRIPAKTEEQALDIVQKIIQYEKNPPSNPSFYENVSNCSYFQDTDSDGASERRFTHTNEEERNYLISKGYVVDRIYSTKNDVNPLSYQRDNHTGIGFYSEDVIFPSELKRSNGFAWDGNFHDITDMINEGRFLVSYRGHGYSDGTGWANPEFITSHFDLLHNGPLLPVMFSINCYTGTFHLESFAEDLLRIKDGGVAGVIAPTCYSFSGYNDGLSIGFYNAIWPDPGLIPAFGTGGITDPELTDLECTYTLGDVMDIGLIRMTETWGKTKHINYQFELYHYLGDPAMKIWTSAPIEIEAIIPQTILMNQVSLNISSSNCPKAKASLMVDGELRAVSNLSGGEATMIFSPINQYSDNAILTLSAHNYRPLIVPINIVNDLANDEPCSSVFIPANGVDHSVTNQNATGSITIPNPSCATGNGTDIWFKTEVPESGKILISTWKDAGEENPGILEIFSGECSALIELECFNGFSRNVMPEIYFCDQTPGDTLFIRYWIPETENQGTFYLRIEENYCPIPSVLCGENYLSRIELETIDHISGCDGYLNFSNSDSTELILSKSYTLTLTNPGSGGSHKMGCWIDWNQDFDFEDENESILITEIFGGGTTQIIVPSNAPTGATRMRISIQDEDNLTPCDSISSGETEDYKIVVKLVSTTKNPIIKPDLILYPNPSPGIFTLEFKNQINSDWVIEVYSILGKRIYSSVLEGFSHSIDLSNQSNGIYFLTLYSKHQKITRKILIAR